MYNYISFIIFFLSYYISRENELFYQNLLHIYLFTMTKLHFSEKIND